MEVLGLIDACLLCSDNHAMMPDSSDGPAEGVRIDFSSGPGVHPVGLRPPEVLEKSERALHDAMAIIDRMANRVRGTVDSMVQRPSQVEVTFGIKFDAEAGALIARTGVEASINVTFRWGPAADDSGGPAVGSQVRAAEASP